MPRLQRRCRLSMTALFLTNAFPLGAQGFGLLGGQSHSNIEWDSRTRCSDFCIISSSPHYGRDANIFGVFYERKVTSVLRFEPELVLAPKGYGPGSDPAPYLTYLELPLLVHFSPPASGASYTRPFLVAGPDIGYLVGCEVTEPGVGPPSCNAPLNRTSASFRPWELSALVGVGFEHHFSKGTELGIEARYSRSLSDVGHDADAFTFNHTLLFLIRWIPHEW
jgi:hypothetical protein